LISRYCDGTVKLCKIFYRKLYLTVLFRTSKGSLWGWARSVKLVSGRRKRAMKIRTLINVVLGVASYVLILQERYLQRDKLWKPFFHCLFWDKKKIEKYLFFHFIGLDRANCHCIIHGTEISFLFSNTKYWNILISAQQPVIRLWFPNVIFHEPLP
jgi:hypothetical protein